MAINIGGLLAEETNNYVPRVQGYLKGARAFNSDGSPTPELLDAIKMTESGGNRFAVSKAGAKGPYQFMPGTAKQYGVADPFNEQDSRQGASDYLTNLYKRFGNAEQAIAAYNAGEGRIERAIAADKKRGGDGSWSGKKSNAPESESEGGFFSGISDKITSYTSVPAEFLANYWLVGLGSVLVVAALIISQKNNIGTVVTTVASKGKNLL